MPAPVAVSDVSAATGRSMTPGIFGSLLVAVVAMAILHVAQPSLDPLAEPVSFYVHGAFGWLLPLALGAFGLAAMLLATTRGCPLPSGPRRSLRWFGVGMLVTALVPSDRWFPWEMPPSLHGLVHAGVAMLAPLLLLHPMKSWAPTRPLARGFAFAYALSLTGSATCLLAGLWRDDAPAFIGLAERALALAAVAWIALATSTAGRPRSQTPA